MKKSLILINRKKAKGRPLDIAKRIEILTPKQMLQGLPLALAQVKAGNTPENLLNKLRQVICSLYRAKEIIEKVYITIE